YLPRRVWRCGPPRLMKPGTPRLRTVPNLRPRPPSRRTIDKGRRVIVKEGDSESRSEGSSRMVVSTDIVGLGLIGFSVNCLMVVFNTIGIEKKDPEKLAGGWGLAHLSLGAMMVLVGVATFMN